MDILVSAYGRILVSMSIEGLFTTNFCTLTLTLYCHEQLLPNGHGFHAQLLQVSAKNACMCIGWWISCRMNPDKDLPLACQACRIRLQRCDLDRMCSQDLCQTPDGAIRPGSSLPSFNAQMIKRLRYLRFDPDSTLLYAQMWTANKNALGQSGHQKSVTHTRGYGCYPRRWHTPKQC